MKQAKMKVLELLEAGKITADEATRLLDAMKRTESQGFYFDEDAREEFEERVSRFTKNVDSFAREFGGKVESVYRDLEPKIKKASNTVLEKTAAIFDDISKSLNESLENAKKSAEAAACADDCCCGEDDNTPKPN
jgi:polyhydroxyalkanoate synthesis regulator phasin